MVLRKDASRLHGIGNLSIYASPKPTQRQGEFTTLANRLEQGITVILCILVLLNIGLWFARLCFHASSLVE